MKVMVGLCHEIEVMVGWRSVLMRCGGSWWSEVCWGRRHWGLPFGRDVVLRLFDFENLFFSFEEILRSFTQKYAFGHLTETFIHVLQYVTNNLPVTIILADYTCDYQGFTHQDLHVLARF